jgi:L-lactate dehydrogenase complex protein LldG
MNSRDVILGRIRTVLSQEPSPPLPPVAEVWPRLNPTADQTAQRFAEELAAVHGETIRCASLDEARQKLAALVGEGGWTQLAAVDRPICRELVAALDPSRVAWAQADWTPPGMAELPAGLVAAECLLADTGSAMIACGTPVERLMCYLPPVCVVVARTGQLVEHMPAAWASIAPRVADPALRGEFVFITGPSRTADIEKILILGVHGPKRLIVLLVD